MRDPADKATAELPTLPGYRLPPSQRDSAGKRARKQGYQGPKDRPRCETCTHVHAYTLAIERFRCVQGDFQVMRGGVCQRYEKKTDKA